MFAFTNGIRDSMMSIKLPELTPPSRHAAKAAPRRLIPGAGLFGWRKEQAAPGAEDRTEKPSDRN